MPGVAGHPRWWPLLALSLLWFAASAAAGDVYQWVDKNGNVHYTIKRREGAAPPHRAEPAPFPLAPAPQAVPESEAMRAPAPALDQPPPVDAAPPETEPPTSESGVGDASAPVAARPPSRPGTSEEIAELEAQIESYREQLKELISAEQPEGTEFVSDPRVREIAEKLPRLQAQLEELRREAE